MHETKSTHHGAPKWQAWVITVSDKASQGLREDRGGPLLVDYLTQAGVEVTKHVVVPDEQAQLESVFKEAADVAQIPLVFTTGGTGFSLRDVTPEATLAVATRTVPGIAEWMRLIGLQNTPRAMLSRAVCVFRDRTLIVNFPGSPKAIQEVFEPVIPVLLHGLETLWQPGQDCARIGS